ncbi:MAG: glycoside hydrolase family 13 protein [Clostridia bacterium]|nr:glycoside hydrolase family 13 protein [Clostridia bacterium]
MRSALHNSRLHEYRSPFGAVRTGDKCVLSLFVSAELNSRLHSVKLRLWPDDHEELAEPVSLHERDGGMLYHFEIAAPDAPCVIWYYFILYTDGHTLYYGGDSGEGDVYDHLPPSFRITVFDREFETPDWFARAIIYQVFPDRFYKSGDDTFEAGAAYHSRLGRPVYKHENWRDEPLFEPLPGAACYNPCDFFGGNLRGIREKLPYLADLGVTCIYLNPVFESPSNHRYNTSDYMRIDPFLGDEAELRALSDAAAPYGIRLMLDGVFSHTGDDSVYFNRYGTYPDAGAYQSRESRYYPWYGFYSFPDSYRCWWGFDTLPEVNELDGSYMEFVRSVLDKYAALGIHSWRLDVADELPNDFIRMLRRELKRNDPNGVLLGEVWEDAVTKTDGLGNRRGYANGDMLDSCMGYPFRDAVVEYLLGNCDARGLLRRLGAICEGYPEPFLRAQMNLLSSHDTQRIISVLGGCPHRDALTREEQARFELSDEALRLGKARYVLAAVIQMAFIGVPCIYYGDEAGLTGLADPFCRKTFPWGDEDAALQAAIRALSRARSRSDALKLGGIAMCAVDESVFTICRTHGEHQAVAAVNRSSDARSVTLCAKGFSECNGVLTAFAGEYECALTGAVLRCTDGNIRLTLPPLGGALLIKRSSL